MMSQKHFLNSVVIAMILLVTRSMGENDNCLKTFSDLGTSFDLSPLKSGLYYKVRNKDVTFENYTYVFNICEDIKDDNIPGAGPRGFGDACVETTPDGRGSAASPSSSDILSGPAPAFQVARVDNFCWRLGNSASNLEWSLLEEDDPSRGVVLKYIGGNECSDSNTKRRSLSIAFPCANDVMNVPDEEVIEETSVCEYEILLPSIYGCPRECGVKDRQLCNNRGVCRYDRTQKRSRCFCSEGWSGDDCGTDVVASSSSSDAATTGVLIFVSILLAVLIAGLIVMWMKIRGLRLDPQAYASLSGGAHMNKEEL